MRRRGLGPGKLRFKNHKSQIPQRGYLMITLMLAMALMAIALLAVLPAIKQQIVRDREEELQHRGTAYMRAIQHFYKKFGRYPVRVEELENTNNLRFLRKRYTDPMSRDPQTGKEKDFKFLHQQDITLNNGPLLGQTPGQGGPGGQGGFGGPGGLLGQGGPQGLGGFGGALSGALTGPQQTPNSSPLTPASGNSGNSSDEENSDSPGTSSPNAGSPNSGSSNSGSNSGSGFNGPTFGGGPILGVASANKKDKSIRVFYDKDHYNDWLFIYLPQADRGGLLTGPVSLNGPTPNLSGAPGGLPGQGGSLLGQGLSTNGIQQNPPAQTPPGPGLGAPQN